MSTRVLFMLALVHAACGGDGAPLLDADALDADVCDADGLDAHANDADQAALVAIAEPISTDHYDLVLGEITKIYEPAPQSLMGSFPNAMSIDVVDPFGRTRRRILAGFSQSEDVPTAMPEPGYIVSDDGGETFDTLLLEGGPDTRNLVQLASAELLAVRFTAISVSGSMAELFTYRSPDSGETWSAGTATFDAGQPIS